MSFPGSTEQQWHVDGDHLSRERHLPCHAMNVFVALNDITVEMGPTELRPASQFLTRDLKRQLMLAKIKKRLHSTVMPGFKPGDVSSHKQSHATFETRHFWWPQECLCLQACMFDYRTLHRGMPNNSSANGEGSPQWEDGLLWGREGAQEWQGKARPMLELTFANSRYNDLLNFPPKSIFDAPLLSEEGS